MKKLIIALAIGILLLLLPPLSVLADDYIAGEAGTIYTQVLNGDGTPANSATVTLTLWASDGVKILDGVTMPHMPDSQGIYSYNFTCPDEIGTYIADVVSILPTGYGSSTIHVSEPVSANITGNYTYTGANATQIWGEDVTDYTGSSTGAFINSIYQFLGGDNMLNPIGVPQIIFASVLLVLALWRKGWIRILLSICIVIWGVFAMPYDVKVAAPLIAAGTVLCIQAILVLIQHAREETDN